MFPPGEVGPPLCVRWHAALELPRRPAAAAEQPEADLHHTQHGRGCSQHRQVWAAVASDGCCCGTDVCPFGWACVPQAQFETSMGFG